ncbi:MAG: DUF1569 domain-containing protein [Saprospiraceae bacterium]
MQNLFTSNGVQTTINRINNLTPQTQAQWGKMNVAQMLAHCCVAYDMTLTDKYPKRGAIAKFFIKLLAKNQVVGPKPYPKNGRTAPEFVIAEERDFEKEKKRLIENIQKVYDLGATHFDGKESHSFGPLTEQEWNTLFSKHLEHHLTQFNV